MMLLELILVACIGMVLCHEKTNTHIAVLPSSYLADVYLWDALYGSAEGCVQLYDSIHQSKIEKKKEFYGRITFLVRLLSGELRDRSYSIIAEAFDTRKDEKMKSGETERVLIMAMVMLSNCGKCGTIPVTNMLGLRHALAKVDADHPPMPQRVRKALKAVQNARHRRDIVRALTTALQDRDNEFLYKCTWRWEKRRNGIRGIHREPLGQGEFIETDPLEVLPSAANRAAAFPLDTRAAAGDQVSFAVPVNTASAASVDVNDRMESLEDQAYTAEEIEQQFGERQNKAGELDSNDEISGDSQLDGESYYMPVGILRRFAVEPTVCGVCNFSFEAQEYAGESISAERSVSLEEEANGTEEENPNTDHVRGWSSLESPGEGRGSASQKIVHLNSPEHKRQLQAFQKYEALVRDTWLPKLKEAKKFVNDCQKFAAQRMRKNMQGEDSINRKNTSHGYLELESMELSHSVVWEKMQEVEKTYEWNKLWEVEQAYNAFILLYTAAQRVWQKELEDVQVLENADEPHLAGATSAIWARESVPYIDEDKDSIDEMWEIAGPKKRRKKNK